MIKEIVAHIKTDDLEILFSMDSGHFDEEIIKTIESLGFSYLIKGKKYPTLASQVTDPSSVFVIGEEGRETTELFMKLDTWDKDIRFVISRVLKPKKDRVQLSFLEGDEFEYFYFVTNTEMASEKVVIAYGAPRKAWHFFQGESPWWTRPNQPSILSVAVVKEAEVEQYN